MSSHPTPRAPLPRSTPSNGHLAEALTKSLVNPLRAMRATIEELRRLHPELGPRARSIDGLLEEVQRLELNVQGLVDHSSPPTPRPTRCCVAELSANLRALLPAHDPDRLWIAFDAHNPELVTDSVILTHALARLAMNALEATGESALITLRVRRTSRGTTLYCTVADATAGVPFDATTLYAPFRSDKPNHLGLGLALARRDIALLGGSLRTHSGPTLATLLVAEIPSDSNPTATKPIHRVAV